MPYLVKGRKQRILQNIVIEREKRKSHVRIKVAMPLEISHWWLPLFCLCLSQLPPPHRRLIFSPFVLPNLTNRFVCSFQTQISLRAGNTVSMLKNGRITLPHCHWEQWLRASLSHQEDVAPQPSVSTAVFSFLISFLLNWSCHMSRKVFLIFSFDPINNEGFSEPIAQKLFTTTNSKHKHTQTSF